jgi:DNA (cytosine-5)-methyltransferase 1
MYAVYRQLVASVSRYAGMRLEPLQRMKSADRKSGTVGDVVVTENGFPVEAVEVKYGQEVAFIHVAEAIDKVRAASVRRYYILSTEGIATADAEAIDRRRAEFLEQNGCEIIINGVLDSLSYYLRLLPSTTDFIFAYVDLLRDDEDATYEHRIAWNECCQGSSP